MKITEYDCNRKVGVSMYGQNSNMGNNNSGNVRNNVGNNHNVNISNNNQNNNNIINNNNISLLLNEHNNHLNKNINLNITKDTPFSNK